MKKQHVIERNSDPGSNRWTIEEDLGPFDTEAETEGCIERLVAKVPKDGPATIFRMMTFYTR